MDNNTRPSNLQRKISEDQILTYRKIYLIVLSIICCLEIYMFIRAIGRFDFTDWKRVSYFCSYLLLLVSSAFTLTLLVINTIRGKLMGVLVVMLDIYSVIVVLWGTLISFLDVSNGHTMIVYLTVIVCIAVLTNLRPIVYSSCVIPTSAALCVSAYLLDSELVATTGYIINFAVFVFFALLLELIKYKLTNRNYITTDKLIKLSFHDQLTGVYNRHSLKERLAAMNDTDMFYFGIVDVDNFKSVNDTYGHDVGDECLKRISVALCNNFGTEVFRYGGDEFVVISSKREDEIVRLVNEINDMLASEYEGKGIHISAGFYCPTSSNEQYKDYFGKADAALYQAKETGKSKAVIYK